MARVAEVPGAMSQGRTPQKRNNTAGSPSSCVMADILARLEWGT
jgi:hypothetical protein